MLTFEWPWALSLLALLPVLVRLRLRQPLPALRYPDAAAITPAFDWPKWLSLWGWLIVFASLIFAIAGPRTPDLRTRLRSDGIAIALVVDVSGSMATPMGSGSRLDAAKVAFSDFLSERPNDAIALVSFAAVPKTDCPPTLNHDVLAKILATLEPRSGVDAGTNIGDAIAEAILRLNAVNAKRKAILLLSDGEHNATGSGADAPLTPRQAAQLAANLKIPLYAIDCGNFESGDDEAKKNREAAMKILEACADLTGGEAFAVDDAKGLQAALAHIGELERTELESFQYRRYRSYRVHCGLAAMIVLAAISMLRSKP